MMFNTAESILIVEAGNTGKFSKLLYNMIGKNDDTEAGPIGPVDGSVDASIFSENQFAQTAISSSQKVVFIGWPEGTRRLHRRDSAWTTPKLSTRKASTSA